MAIQQSRPPALMWCFVPVETSSLRAFFLDVPTNDSDYCNNDGAVPVEEMTPTYRGPSAEDRQQTRVHETEQVDVIFVKDAFYGDVYHTFA